MAEQDPQEYRDTLAADDVGTGIDAPHPAGVRRTATLFAILAMAAVLPYVVPSTWSEEAGVAEDLARLRVVRPGKPLPFERLVALRPPPRPVVAGVAEVQESLAEDVLDGAPIAGTNESVASAAPVSVPANEGQGDLSLRIPAEDYARLPLPISDDEGAMESFYRSLRRVAMKREGAKARILVYSDSINGSDRVSQVLRHRLQERFGDGGKGWVPAAPGWQSHRTQDVDWESNGYRAVVLNRGERDSGFYGLGGVVAVDERGTGEVEVATVGSTSTKSDGSAYAPGRRTSTFEVYFEKAPGRGTLAIELDGQALTTLSTASSTLEAGTWRTTVPDGPHRLRIATEDAPASLYGLVLEREEPGVVVDGLALIGAFTRVLGNWDAAHWQQQLKQRDPALLVFWLGGNDTVSDQMGFRREEFVDQFAEILATAREANDASCLVLSVLDSAREVDGDLRSRRRVPRVVDAQKLAAGRAGCAFWDGYRATGGRGTAGRWFRHRPKLLGVDYRHLTRSGAEVFGTLLERALLHGYDHWLARQQGDSGAE